VSDGGIRITAEDLLTGHVGICVLGPGGDEPYALFLAAPLYLHSKRTYGNGTIVLTLRRSEPIEHLPDQVTLMDTVSQYGNGDVHVHLLEECPAVGRAIRRHGDVNRRPGTLADFHSPGPHATRCGWCARSRKVPKP
jgi:hypothetical protein